MKIEVPDHIADLLRDLAPDGVDPARLGMGLLVSKVYEVALKHQPYAADSIEAVLRRIEEDVS